jgi:hypothetical protein
MTRGPICTASSSFVVRFLPALSLITSPPAADGVRHARQRGGHLLAHVKPTVSQSLPLSATFAGQSEDTYRSPPGCWLLDYLDFLPCRPVISHAS